MVKNVNFDELSINLYNIRLIIPPIFIIDLVIFCIMCYSLYYDSLCLY